MCILSGYLFSSHKITGCWTYSIFLKFCINGLWFVSLTPLTIYKQNLCIWLDFVLECQYLHWWNTQVVTILKCTFKDMYTYTWMSYWHTRCTSNKSLFRLKPLVFSYAVWAHASVLVLLSIVESSSVTLQTYICI